MSQKGINNSYNAWQKLKVTDVSVPYEIQMTEMYIGNEAEQLAVSENMYNCESNASCQWVLMKFEVKNLGSSNLTFSNIIEWVSTYLPTGQKSTMLSTCVFGDLPNYNTVIEPNATKEAWLGFYVLKSQGLPFLKLENGAYLSTHPSCSKGHNFASTTAKQCSTCHALASNILYKENGKYYHMINGKKVTDTTLVKHTDGKWYYVNKGVVDRTKTGLVKQTDGKYYYVKDGIVDFTKTALIKHTDGNYYYVKKGVKTDSTLLFKHTDGKWYYVYKGKVNFTKTGLVKHSDGKYYYVSKGKIDFSKTALIKHTDGNYYHVKKGVKTSSTLLFKHTDGKWYYVYKGKVNFTKTGLVKHTDGKYYYVVKGKIDFSKTTLVKHTNGKWYYVKKGVVDFTKNGKVTYNGKKYTVKKGVVV